MPNDLAKLNRLRVNAEKPELKSWKASQAKLDAAIKVLEDAGHVDVLPGANVSAVAETPDPKIAAAREETPPPLSESALAKNIGKTAEKEERPTTKVKAHLARGLDTDQYARHSRERVRDIREAEKKEKRKNKVELSDADKKQIKDEAEARGKVDSKKDPVKAARQTKHIADKKAKREKEGKTTKQVGKDETTVADIARDLGIDPKVARAKLRRHEDKLTKLHTKGQDRWTFPKTAAGEIKKILKGAK